MTSRLIQETLIYSLRKTVPREFLQVKRMVGILGKAPLTSDIALFLEIGVFILLIIGRYRFAGPLKVRSHGYMMALTTAIHALSVFLVMIPSLARSLNVVVSELTNPVILITLVHIPSGAVALVFASYFVAKWAFKGSQNTCYGSYGKMRPLWFLWLFSLGLGFVIYAVIAWFS